MSSKASLHAVSPLRESVPMSKEAGTTVYLKLDTAQPTGSFKIRGIGHLCKTWAERGCERFVCSSGGNAGLAAAYSARKLGVPATILVPSSTPSFTIQRLKDEGASVSVVGEMLDETIEHAMRLAENNPGWVYIPPFDDPLIWEGHASIVTELQQALDSKPGAIVLSVGGGGLLCGVVQGLRAVGWQDVPIIAMETEGAHSLNAAVQAGELVTLPEITREGHSSIVTELQQALDSKPGAIVLSVGGGGLLCGVVQGLRAVGWQDVPIIAMETEGAHSLNAAVQAGELVTLPEITSVAKTLGAKRVGAQTLKVAKEHPVFSELVSDQEAVGAIEKFVDDEKILVEPACGAALAAVYCNTIRKLQGEGKLSRDLESVVIVVCGGNNITLGQLQRLKEQLGMPSLTAA
ncbi:UNVERIFIED_CONTAM: hypothetical protein FKN15_039230 [Acipenser sinensis]